MRRGSSARERPDARARSHAPADAGVDRVRQALHAELARAVRHQGRQQSEGRVVVRGLRAEAAHIRASSGMRRDKAGKGDGGEL